MNRADTGADEVRERLFKVPHVACEQHFRAEETFLRAPADSRNDYLAAVAFDLRVSQGHRDELSSRDCARRGDLLDDVFFNRLDGYAAVAQPGERAFDLIGAAFEFDGDQSHLLGNAGAADVEYQVELLHEMIKDRLLDQRARIAQVVAFVNSIHQTITFSRRSLFPFEAPFLPADPQVGREIFVAEIAEHGDDGSAANRIGKLDRRDHRRAR